MRDDNADRLAIVCIAGATLLYLAADLASRTMGLDGVVYAGVASHLSDGIGSFWYPPHFDSTVSAFHDHPPLGLWLQSLWFALWGGEFWVERLYCLLLLVVLIYLVTRVYRSAGGSAGWWPLLFVLPIPVITRTVKSNLLETLVAIVALLAVWAAWQGRGRHRGWDVAVGFLCVAGALIKGPVAIFPLAAPGIIALIVDRSFAQAFIRSLVTGAAFVLPFLLLLIYDPAFDSLSKYLEVQLMASLTGERPAEHDQVYLLGQMIVQLGILVIVLLAAMSFLPGRFRFSRESLAHLLIGLAGTLPLLISPRQYRHYLMPAMPFFALAAATLISPPALTRVQRALPWLAGLLIVAALVRAVWLFGTPGKDQDLLADAEKIAAAAAARGVATVSFCETADHLRLYLWRNHGVRTAVQEAPGLNVCTAEVNAQRVAELSESRVLWWREEAQPVTFKRHSEGRNT